MKTARLLMTLTLPLAVLGSTGRADAAQVWPFEFDPNLDANPANIQSQLTSGGASLPPLPVGDLTMLTTDKGTMKLWLWPQNAALLTAIGSAGPSPMTWPTTAKTCAKHAAFTMPTLTATGTTCTNAATQITQAITSNQNACILTEQPERYVLGYKPSDVSSDVGNIEDMIGLVGEALTHAGPPLDGILPPTFVDEMRTVIDKIRYDKLVAALKAASAGYAQASSLLGANAACFEPAVKTALAASLVDLAAEVTAISTYLDNLEKAGEAANAQETMCLSSKAHTRNVLPYPGLTQSEREFTAFWLGALYWRLRGGGLIPLGSTQEARLYYADDGFSQISALLAADDGPKNVGTNFLTELVLDGWAQWQAMGTNNDDKYADIIGMSERGQRQVNASISAFKALGYDTAPLLTGALQMGPGYYYGYYPLGSFRYAPSLTAPYSGFVDAPTAIGELNIGGAIGLGLAKTLLPGKPTGQPPTVVLCANRECGDDGCGGSCGSCEGGAVCNASGMCAPPGATSMDGGGAPSGPSAQNGADADISTSTSGDGGASSTDDSPTGANGSGCSCKVGGTTNRDRTSDAKWPFALVALGASLLFARRARRRVVSVLDEALHRSG